MFRRGRRGHVMPRGRRPRWQVLAGIVALGLAGLGSRPSGVGGGPNELSLSPCLERQEGDGCVTGSGMCASSGQATDEGFELPSRSLASRVEGGDTIPRAVMVRNDEEGLWNPETRWSIREEFRLGAADGRPELLFGGHLTSVSLGPQGHIFVLDFVAQDIRVFDGQGGFLRRFGGAGGGPGEFNVPVGMGWDGAGRLWIANGFSGHYTVFDSSGTFVKTVPRPVRGMRRRQFPLWFDTRGHLVDEGTGGGGVDLIQVDTTGTRVDTLSVLSNPRRPGFVPLPPNVDRTLLEHLPSLRWAIAPDGTVWSAESGDLRLIQTTLRGDTLRVVETRHRSTNVSRTVRRQIEAELDRVGISRSDYTLARPIVQALHVMSDGHILVQIGEGAGHYSGRILDVFDPEGRFLGTMDLGFNLTAVGFPALRGDTLVGVTLGEFDVPYVVRATILRN
jgi:hypothetical protein